MLKAFFDESGTHRGSPATVVAGYVGTDEQFVVLARAWAAELKRADLKTFHYAEFQNRLGVYKTMSVPARSLLVNGLAAAVVDSGVRVISGAFVGDFEQAITQGPNWRVRFDSSYSVAFDLVVLGLQQHSAANGDEPVAVTFSRHDQYGRPARRIWRTHRHNGHWKWVHSCDYRNMRALPELQAADMIAYETYRSLKANDDEEFRKWPLIGRFIARDDNMIGGKVFSDTLVEVMTQIDIDGRQLLKDAPKNWNPAN